MVKTVSDLHAEIDTQFADNHARSITPAKQRTVLKDIVSNIPVTAGQVLADSGTPNSSTFLRGDNIWATPAGGGGGGTFTGTGDPGLTRAQHIATTYTTPPNIIRTSGYDAPGDWGGAMYIKVDAQPDHKGWFQTNDGAYFELYPSDGFVTPQMFGGKSPSVYNARDNDIGPASNDAVDYIIFNRFGKVDLYYPPSAYFIATTVQLKGGGFNVRGANASANGAGTYMMTDYYTTGFVGHHGSFSFEAFGSVYFNNRGIELGEMVYNGGVLGTHTYICTQAGTTSSDGSQHPTGTGNNQTDGTVKWDYYREATRVELTGTAWGGEFFNIFLYSHYDGTQVGGTGSAQAQTHYPAVGPWSQKPSGFLSSAGPWKPAFGFLGRARAHVHHCWMGGFSAHGCAFIANGDLDFPTITGNVNDWAITDSAFYYNAMDGMHNSYSDGNAGYAAHIDLSTNGRMGYFNQGFLGDLIAGIQSAFDGRNQSANNQRFPTAVAHAGYYYYARMGQLGTSGIPDYGAVTPTPGASNSAWVLVGGDGTWVSDNWNFPDWVSGYTYEAGGAFGSNNVNARHTWLECYIEGNTFQAQFRSRDVVIGGLMQGLFIGAGSNLLQDGNWYNPISYQSVAHNFSAAMGYGGIYGDKGEGILFWKDTSDNEYTLRTDSYENDGATYATDNYTWAINRFPQGYWLKNGQTAKSYGRSSAIGGGAFAFHRFFTASDGDCRQFDFSDAAPTSGAWARGDRVSNRSAAVGQPKGWICTVAGTPGTWVSEGNL